MYDEGDRIAAELRNTISIRNGEIKRLRGMIEYARDAPTIEGMRRILQDALYGCTGADNVAEVRAKRAEGGGA